MAVTPFMGGIYMFSGSFQIANTLLCDGRILPIQPYSVLFSIIGTTYGGNGTTTFSLPDLRGTLPIGMGNNYTPGSQQGSELVPLIAQNLPAHNHGGSISAAIGTGGPAVTATTINSLPGTTTGTDLYTATPGVKFMSPMTNNLNNQTQIAGDGIPHNNMQPYLSVNFLIATSGVFPSRN